MQENSRDGHLGVSIVENRSKSRPRFEIRCISPHSAADRCGRVSVGDAITRVNGEDVMSLSIDEVRARVADGRPGSAVTLGLERTDGGFFSVTLIREPRRRGGKENVGDAGVDENNNHHSLKSSPTPSHHNNSQPAESGESPPQQQQPQPPPHNTRPVMMMDPSSAFVLSERERVRAEAELRELSSEMRRRQAMTDEYSLQLRRRAEQSAEEARQETTRRVEADGIARRLAQELEETRARMSLTIGVLEDRVKSAEAEIERGRAAAMDQASTVPALREQALVRELCSERAALQVCRDELEKCRREMEHRAKMHAMREADLLSQLELEKKAVEHGLERERLSEEAHAARTNELQSQFDRQLQACKRMVGETSDAAEEANERQLSAVRASAVWQSQVREAHEELERQKVQNTELRRMAMEISRNSETQIALLKQEVDKHREEARVLGSRLQSCLAENRALHVQIQDINAKMSAFAGEVSARCFWDLNNAPLSTPAMASLASSRVGSRAPSPVAGGVEKNDSAPIATTGAATLDNLRFASSSFDEWRDKKKSSDEDNNVRGFVPVVVVGNSGSGSSGFRRGVVVGRPDV